MKFSEKLKSLREKNNMTQKECADAIGVTRRTYISYEVDGRHPSTREIYLKLAELFHVEVEYLMTEDEEFLTEASEQYGSRGMRQAEALLNEMSGLFAGGELSESDQDAIMLAMQRIYFECKERNKKYTPKKYRHSNKKD